MTCHDLLKLLNEHVDGTLDVAACAEFESHLAGCHPCQVVVDNIRHTITLLRDGRLWEMPASFQASLRVSLAAKWKSEGPQKPV